MSKPFKHTMDDHKPKRPFGMKRPYKGYGLKPRRFRAIPYSEMTDAQKRICDAAERPGTPVPTNLSGDDLAEWFVARALAKVSAS